jgi:outer membrane immunogenic protein
MRVLRTGIISLAAAAIVGLAATVAVADGSATRGPSWAAGYGMPSIWQGVYGGVHIGGVDTGDDDGLVGGVQLGYNWQTGAIVYGVEADISLSGADHVDWLASARGRLGYLILPNLLLYGTAGLGMVNDRDTDTGFAYGVGVEGRLSSSTSARLEYLAYTAETARGDDVGVIRAGLNIKLGR